MIYFHRSTGVIEVKDASVGYLYIFPDDLINRPYDAMRVTCTSDELSAVMKIREAQANPGKWIQ